MKVAFDHQIFALQKYGGISRYFCNLTEELLSLPDIDARIFAPMHQNEHLAGTNGKLGKGKIFRRLPSTLTGLAMEVGKVWSRNSIKNYSPDIIHETYFTMNDFKPSGTMRVVTVYDMIHERYPNMFNQDDKTSVAKKEAVRRADHVICISNSTRKDLIELYGIPEEKTSVIYLSAEKVFSRSNNASTNIKNNEKPYFLYVGMRGGYKNFEKFIKAFANSHDLKQNFDVRCFGGGYFSKTEKEMMITAGIQEEQIHFHAGEDHVLASLYKSAEAFVYPSLYEGFGIPPLEAMLAGCPVLSSSTSSLPEVIGKGGVYFDPRSEDDIKRALEKIAGNKTFKRDLVERGYQQQKKFSWKKCANETAKLYEGIL